MAGRGYIVLVAADAFQMVLVASDVDLVLEAGKRGYRRMSDDISSFEDGVGHLDRRAAL